MFGKLKNYQVSGGRVTFEFEGSDGLKPCVEVITDTIFNVFVDYDGLGHRSRAIEEGFGEQAVFGQLPQKEAETEVKKEGSAVVIRSKKVTAKVNDGFAVDFYDREGNPLSLAWRGERKEKTGLSERELAMLAGEGHAISGKTKEIRAEERRSLDREDCIYGLGDKTGFLNKRHYEYVMWNSDIPDPHEDNFKSLYKSIPFMLVLKQKGVYGIFFDNHCKSFFDLGKESEDYYVFGAEEGNLDYYFIGGDSLKDVISDYTAMTGRAPMQQLWTLGYHQSRWGYESEEKIREVAEGLRRNNLPCDCIHFDIDYMDNYKVFTWNKETYQDEKKVISDLKDMGIKAVTIIDPGVKVEKDYYVYEEGIQSKKPKLRT